MKIDLSNTTFIIPVRIESSDRVRNVITVLCFLLEKFDTKVIIKEVDTKPVFSEYVLPQVKEYLGEGVKNLTHIFEHSDDPVFYRMKILNEMLYLCTTDVVVNYDCDVLLKTSTYLKAYDMIVNDGYDLVYPYGMGNYQKQIFADDELVSQFLSNDFDFSILESKHNIYMAEYGHCQFFNRKRYIQGGMENENFRGSSPEDKERFYRFTTLGYHVGRIGDFIYHLEHSRGSNSWPNSVQGNPHMQSNFELWESIQKMSNEELKKYYKYQKYLEKYINYKIPGDY
jgi:predicted glycosyltransferase involved in capsule biosynthesis